MVFGGDFVLCVVSPTALRLVRIAVAHIRERQMKYSLPPGASSRELPSQLELRWLRRTKAADEHWAAVLQ